MITPVDAHALDRGGLRQHLVLRELARGGERGELIFRWLELHYLPSNAAARRGLARNAVMPSR
jgi:hypothetical protein